MDIKRKLEITEQAIRSVAEHTDADAAVIDAALQAIAEQVHDAREANKARLQQSIEQALG